ncbi:MAG: transglycosylase domain-containing protein [Acidimicrobiales bacterium]
MVRALLEFAAPLLRAPERPPPPVIELPPDLLFPEGPQEPDWLRRFRRAVIRTGGRGLWLLVCWFVTVTLAGIALGLATVVAVRTASRISSNAASHSPPRPIPLAPLATRSVVYARDGSVLTVLHAEIDRVPIELAKVPPHVVRAVLDAEDERFYDHGALDLRSMLRAAVANVEAGSVSEGGSTITQQLVKIELLSAKKDVQRKLKEAVLAHQLEQQLTKDQILERYLNAVYFGNGAYGISAAAQLYYRTDVEDLTSGQAVLLAGLIRYPGGSDPFVNPDEARARRAVVADRMVFLGHATEEDGEAIKNEPLPTPPAPREAQSSDYFAEHVKQELLGAEWLGDTPEERYRAVFMGGLAIHTTLDPKAQQVAEDTVERIVPDDPRGFTAALVSVDPATGAVRALVGGRNFDKAKFNLVTDGDGRQTGSAFKMFTLMAALEAGYLPTDTISGSQPCSIPNPGGEPNPWVPGNVEGQGGGTMSLQSATVSSVNCAYARLIKVVGPEKVVDVARRLGVTNPLGAHLALTLGSEPVTPLQMASAYATVAADGIRHDPHFVEKVESDDGSLVWRHDDRGVRAVSAQNARVMAQVLTQVVASGTGTAAALAGRQVAGKTGSADGNADAWFVGFTPQLSTAVWMGAPEARVSMYNVGAYPRVYGGTYPAMIFGAYLREVLAGQPAPGFAAPAPNPRGGRYISMDESPSRTTTTVRTR